MRSTIVAFILAGLGSGATLKPSLDKRLFNCVDLGLPVTDGFDDRTVLPVGAEVGVPQVVPPNGTYINYTQTLYANVQLELNLITPSEPNVIFIAPGTDHAVLVPAFRGANAFKLSSLRYACSARANEDVLVVPASCDVTVSCQVWGPTGPNSGPVVTKSFSYAPANLLQITYGTATFPTSFRSLSQCNVTLVDATILGVVPPLISNPVATVELDNVVNQGQYCHV